MNASPSHLPITLVIHPPQTSLHPHGVEISFPSMGPEDGSCDLKGEIPQGEHENFDQVPEINEGDTVSIPIVITDYKATPIEFSVTVKKVHIGEGITIEGDLDQSDDILALQAAMISLLGELEQIPPTERIYHPVA
jgi:hypothetical protein